MVVELLNFYIVVVLMFFIIHSIDPFADWGNPSRLTSVILLIDSGEPYQLPVGSRNSLLDLVTIYIFM